MNLKQEVDLSVIIPFRCESESNYFLMDRLRNLIKTFPSSYSIEFIVIDSGSSPKYQAECKDICSKNNINYKYHETLGKPFSIGECRDFGVQYAAGRAVSFLDVDLRASSDFWPRLLSLMESWGISKYKKSFLAIPCIYLTQEGTVEFLNNNDESKFLDLYLRYLQGDKQAVENVAFCSSVMIVDRYHYLSVGGHDLEFRGHGYEDFELYHRLLCDEAIIPKTDDYYIDQKTWSTSTYKGFRSHLAIIGRPAMMNGLFVIHLWHPRPKDVSFYSPQSLSNNRTIWQAKFKEFEAQRIHPQPLINKKLSEEVTLFFAKSYKSPSASSLRDILPHLGKIIYVDEYNFIDCNGSLDEDSFKEMLASYKITKIVFPNPYGNEARLEIYKWCKKTKFPFYCYDRGALPDSWFLDSKGFNADSESYKTKYWDYELDSKEKIQVNQYIEECIYGNNFLEAQSIRVGGEALSNRLQTGSKKVLFVPLQRPSDSVIKYMAGEAQSSYYFLNLIDLLAEQLLSKGWIVLCKKHPLETDSPSLRFAKYVPEDTNFIDVLELADRVALINSGVGVYAMMMEKPCYIFGESFYQHDGINRKVSFVDINNPNNISDLAKEIVKGFEVDKLKAERFINYLINEFYSFGTPKMISKRMADGSLRTITNSIDFYDFKIDKNVVFKYERKQRPKIDLSAPIFERYALDIHMKKKLGKVGKTSLDRKNKQEVKLDDSKDKLSINKVEDTQSIVRSHVIQQNKPKKTKLEAKFAKFKRDPYNFFADAKNPLGRSLKFFYKN